MQLFEINLIIIILVLWCIPWIVYNQFIRKPAFNFMGNVLIPLPNWFTCAIPYVSPNPDKNRCEDVHFDWWTVGHLLIYFTLGLFVPKHYLLILVISILCESYEYISGWRARWLLDPISNMIGYIIGSLLAVTISASMKDKLDDQHITVIGILALFALLYFNKPTKKQS
jgi:hypothetical protein